MSPLARILLLLVCLMASWLPAITLAAAESRLALVIGNAAYKSSPLANPVNDARLMEAALTEAGFTVIKAENASIREMRRLVRDFGDRLKATGGIGLFYFAGHGVQVRGENFLVSTDSDIRNEDEVPDDSVNVSVVLDKMQSAGNRMNLIILDACRDNPFANKSRSAANGLATLNAPSGSLVAYATAPGSVASDGRGRNGLYTQHLANAIREAGLPVEEVFKRVRTAVRKDSGNQQTPWENTALEGQFFFKAPVQKPAAAVAMAAVKPAPVPAPAPSAARTSGSESVAVEMAYWDSIKNSRRAAELQAYLSQYPNGLFASLAKARINEIRPNPAAETPAKPAQAQGGVPSGTTQKWSYQPYDSKGAPAGTGGYIEFAHKGDDSTLQFFAGKMEECWLGPLKAKLARTESTITITPEPRPKPCGTVRFVIKADGTGGTRESRVGDTWRRDGLDRKLVLMN